MVEGLAMDEDGIVERATKGEVLSWGKVADKIVTSEREEPVVKEKLVSLLGESKVFYGVGSFLSSLREGIIHLQEAGRLPEEGRPKVLLVSSEKSLDRVGLKGAGTASEWRLLLKQVDFVRFTEFPPTPASRDVAEGAISAFSGGVDLIVAIGGGSSIDMAKSINTALADNRIIKALENLKEKISTEDNVKQEIIKRFSEYLKGMIPFDEVRMKLPLVAVPTTAGTGSEATACAVINDSAKDDEKLFMNGHLVPDIIILDPKTTLTLPERLTRSAGADAFVQTVEAYIGRDSDESIPGSTPEIRATAKYGMKLIIANLTKALSNPEDLKARSAMLLGSFLSGVAFSSSHLGPAHDIGHAIEKAFPGQLLHGETTARLLVPVLEEHVAVAKASDLDEKWRRQAQQIAQRITDLGGLMGRKGDRPEDGISAVADFLVSIKAPVNLKDLPKQSEEEMKIILEHSRFPGANDASHLNLFDVPWWTEKNYRNVLARTWGKS